MKLMQTFALWASVFTLRSRAQQEPECNYYDGDTRCLNPDATASATIDIKPLFSSPPTLVYAIDNLTDDQIATEADKYRNDAWWIMNYDRRGGGEVQKIGFWMEYDEDSLNYTESSERRYDLALIFTRSPNPIGGSDGGCEQLLGSECVESLREIFRWNGFRRTYWGDLMERPLRNLSCPIDIFEDDQIPSLRDTHDYYMIQSYYAIESNNSVNSPHRPRPAGSSRNTTSLIYSPHAIRFRTFENQKNTAAVVVSVVTPQDQDSNGDHMPIRSEAVVSFACARPGLGGGADGQDPEGEDDDDGSGSSLVEAGFSTIILMVLSFVALLFM